MRPGTIVRLPDGREGTVVYHGLDGYGIQWGNIRADVERILSGNGATAGHQPPGMEDLYPQAMLRSWYPGCGSRVEYVGDDYEIVEPEHPPAPPAESEVTR